MTKGNIMGCGTTTNLLLIQKFVLNSCNRCLRIYLIGSPYMRWQFSLLLIIKWSLQTSGILYLFYHINLRHQINRLSISIFIHKSLIFNFPKLIYVQKQVSEPAARLTPTKTYRLLQGRFQNQRAVGLLNACSLCLAVRLSRASLLRLCR